MHFWRLASPDLFTDSLIVGEHSHIMCLFASVLAVLAALVLFKVVQRYHYGNPQHKIVWLFVGSLGMGAGIWAMHFTAMLAYILPFEASYDLTLTLLSIVPAIVASCACILIYEPSCEKCKRFPLSAVTLVTGVGAMHFVGMEALVVSADMYYRPNLVFAAVVVGLLFAILGFCAPPFLSTHTPLSSKLSTALGCLLIGLSVSGTHFVAMEATYFHVGEAQVSSVAKIPPYTLDGIITTITLGLMVIILIGTMLDKKIVAVERSLKFSERRFHQLAKSSQSAIFTFDTQHIYYCNIALIDITGFSKQKLTSHPIKDLFGDDFNEIIEEYLNTKKACVKECQIITADQKTKWLYFSLTPTDFGSVSMGSAIDITGQKQAQLNLVRMAYTDQLTGLANRARLLERLDHHLLQLNLQTNDIDYTSILIMLDLNKFKEINDTFGHQQADIMLKQFSHRLQEFCSKSDTSARIGGDEFIVLFENTHSENGLKDLINQLQSHLCRSIEVDQGIVDPQINIGILKLTSKLHRSADDALRDVDIALNHAKELTNKNWLVFEESLDKEAKRQREIQSALKEAVYNKQLTPYYQPIINLKENKILGFECLSRWQRSNGEWVSPVEFIPIAENMGLIADIGIWVTQTAARQLSQWNDLLGHKDLYITVNLATVSFVDDRLYSLLKNLIEKYSLRPQQIKLELTESILMSDTESMIKRLNRLTQLGCDIVFDDFGTGYSSLSYIHRLPASILKIDRSFIQDVDTDSNAVSIIRTIVSLGKSLGMRIVCEGIETKAQAQCLLDLNCSIFQGFLYGKPMPQEQASEYLARQPNFLNDEPYA